MTEDSGDLALLKRTEKGVGIFRLAQLTYISLVDVILLSVR